MSKWSATELAYCSNVHPGIYPNEIENNLREITAKVRRQRALPRMQAGLWINQVAAKAYQSASALDGLVQCLQETQLDVVTLNGFPQNNFHEPIVKDKVYQPTWAQVSRLDYSINIAQILARCMPANQTLGTISTLPLGYRVGWNNNIQKLACKNLCQFALAMARLEDNTGKQIRLCLEMEPGCVLENTQQVISLFHDDLAKAARTEGMDQNVLNRYLGVCYDVCHQAVMQESVNTSFGELVKAGIVVGKIQVSSALQIDNPERVAVRNRLQDFAEPKYLHQLSTRDIDNNFVFNDDLINAINDEQFPVCSPWWVHFHIPIQVEYLDVDGISTTQHHIKQLCDFLAVSLDYKPHIEVETYTWDVLPQGHWVDNEEASQTSSSQRLIQGITSELNWLEQEMKHHHLFPCQQKRINQADCNKVLTLLRDLGFNLSCEALLMLDVNGALDEFREHLGGALCITLLNAVGSSTEVNQIDSDAMQDCVSQLQEFQRVRRPA